ncbi:polymorphic toxin type 37 domain-containing protein [Papillibacter cinnamivorans]|uniref:Toxin 37 n=1 Tax=Papillibacter cinnamivorans DSM 12816 TaxID=1122930 RepID=A0A1W2C5T1_9FIRM|nr:polymorphic toxin type 37 domain-containing protein [Papillibacter cinnamivorans]SMC80615.1 toxin 37 [Papillibacter cinnamivorans DSM 12816]
MWDEAITKALDETEEREPWRELGYIPPEEKTSPTGTDLRRSFRTLEREDSGGTSTPRPSAYDAARNALDSLAVNAETGESTVTAPRTPAYLSVRNALDSQTVGSGSGINGKTVNPESIPYTPADSLESKEEHKPYTAAADSRMLREDRYAEENMAGSSDRLKSLEKAIQLQKAKTQGLSDAYQYDNAEREQKTLDLLEKQYASENKRDLDRFIAEWTEEIDRQRQEQREQEILDLYNLYVPLPQETVASREDEGYTGNGETAGAPREAAQITEKSGGISLRDDSEDQERLCAEYEKGLKSAGPFGKGAFMQRFSASMKDLGYSDNDIYYFFLTTVTEHEIQAPDQVAARNFVNGFMLGGLERLQGATAPIYEGSNYDADAILRAQERADRARPVAAQLGELAGYAVPSAVGAEALGAVPLLQKLGTSFLGRSAVNALSDTAVSAASGAIRGESPGEIAKTAGENLLFGFASDAALRGLGKAGKALTSGLWGAAARGAGKIAGDLAEDAGDVPKYPGNDPVKVPAEGYEWRGNGVPGSKYGNWYNPNTKEWLRPDLNHPEPIAPHWDYGASNGKTYRIFPDGTFEVK